MALLVVAKPSSDPDRRVPPAVCRVGSTGRSACSPAAPPAGSPAKAEATGRPAAALVTPGPCEAAAAWLSDVPAACTASAAAAMISALLLSLSGSDCRFAPAAVAAISTAGARSVLVVLGLPGTMGLGSPAGDACGLAAACLCPHGSFSLATKDFLCMAACLASAAATASRLPEAVRGVTQVLLPNGLGRSPQLSFAAPSSACSADSCSCRSVASEDLAFSCSDSSCLVTSTCGNGPAAVMNELLVCLWKDARLYTTVHKVTMFDTECITRWAQHGHRNHLSAAQPANV